MKHCKLLLAALLIASPVAADPATPWSQGVPQSVQDQANKLFAEGNQLFAQQKHAPALEKYRAAIALWDHPLIRFNTAVTLIRLDRPLDAADELEKALRYGQQGVEEYYQQALDYQALLKNQVSHVQVSCDQTGANILLDGKPWFTCPGSQKIRVAAGEHAVAAEHSGFLPVSRRIVAVGGATMSEKITLVPLESAVTLEYPYQRWIPWTITGAGAAIALGGLGFWLSGRSQMNDFEANFANDCPLGCEADLSMHRSLRDQRDGAELKGTVGITMMITGGAATIGGVVFAIMNRPRRVMPSIEVAPTTGGMSARISWRF